VIRKIKSLGRARTQRAPLSDGARAVAGDAARGETRTRPLAFRQRPFPLVPPRIIAIGSSTGGPQALASLLGAASPSLSRVAQHMPPVFTAILAERLARATGRETGEGVEVRR